MLETLNYYRRIFKYLFLHKFDKAPPPQELYFYILCAPYHLWNQVVRYEGFRFCEYILDLGKTKVPESLKRFPLIFPIFLVVLPWLHAFLVPKNKQRFLLALRVAVKRPDLAIQSLGCPFTRQECERKYSEVLNTFFMCIHYYRKQEEFFQIDSKTYFADWCETHRFPCIQNISLEEASTLDEVIVKDIRLDQGKGVELLKKHDLASCIDRFDSNYIFQKRLKNSDELLTLVPEGTPLATLRVITFNPSEPKTVHAFIKFGKKGSIVDNLFADAVASQIDITAKTLLVGRIANLYMSAKRNDQMFERLKGAESSFVNYKIQNIEDIFNEAEKAHKLLANAAVIGWDVAITDEGFVFVEANLCSGSFESEQFTDLFKEQFFCYQSRLETLLPQSA
ncbi:MAG: hypothetical protein HRU19_29450 [Pseudobacteriovorax sp.]|nr:hypothetical protein [Pseudobacteriovorax sp.]